MAEPDENAGEVVSAAIDSDSELNAMRSVLSALVPLKREGRARVLDYVLKRLGMQSDQVTQASVAAPSGSSTAPGLLVQKAADIRSLANDKAPRSANEMAALVAYYLSERKPIKAGLWQDEGSREGTVHVRQRKTLPTAWWSSFVESAETERGSVRKHRNVRLGAAPL